MKTIQRTEGIYRVSCLFLRVLFNTESEHVITTGERVFVTVSTFVNRISVTVIHLMNISLELEHIIYDKLRIKRML